MGPGGTRSDGRSMAGGLNGRGTGDMNVPEAGVGNGRERDERQRDSRTLRVTFAPGTGPDSSPTVVHVDPTGRATLEGNPEAATLTLDRPPRARLREQGADHDVLMTPLPDARRAAA